MFSSLAIVCLILGVFIVDDIAVEARSCKTGGLQCSSEQGNSVDFCSWDPHAWITQDNVICTACDDILLGGSQGIRCDAVALYNQFVCTLPLVHNRVLAISHLHTGWERTLVEGTHEHRGERQEGCADWRCAI